MAGNNATAPSAAPHISIGDTALGWAVKLDKSSSVLTWVGSTGDTGCSGSQSRLASYIIRFRISGVLWYLKLSKTNTDWRF